jgi:iron complex outermembrane receptor protein
MIKRIVLPVLVSLQIALPPGVLGAPDSSAQPNLLDMSLEDLMKVEVDSVYGASGYKQDVSDAPASITVITADEIERYGYRTLADILRTVPGFYVTSDRVFSYVGVRGFGPPGDYNSRLLLLIDGHWMNDSVTGGAVFGTEMPFDIDLVDRVEVIRGPNSSVYIASGLLAIVNVVTKSAAKASGLSASEELASFRTYKSNLRYSHQFKSGLQVLLSTTYYFSHGLERIYFPEFNNPATNHGWAEDADGGRFYSEFAKLSYRGLTLEGSYGTARKVDPTGSWGAIFNDSANDDRLMQGYVDLSYDHHFGGDWGYLGRIYYDNDGFGGTTPYDESAMGGPSRVLNQTRMSGQGIGASFELSKKLPRGQTVIVGGEYRDNFSQHQWNYDEEPYVLYSNSRVKTDLLGMHVQDEIPLSHSLTLDAGLSYDHYSTFGGTANPRAGLIFRPREATSLKFLYGNSYRAPTALELYSSVPGQEPNPALGPERARTMELVVEQSLARNFHLVASGYYYPIRGVIAAETDPATGLFDYQNKERIDLRGSEIAVKRQSRTGLEAGLSLSLENAKSLGTSAPLTNSPRSLCTANLSVPLLHKKLYASTDLQYVSKRLTWAGNYAGAYFVPNFTLSSQKALRKWEFSGSLYNAFDDVYGDPASVAHRQDIIYQDGRTFRLKFVYHF